MVPRRFLFVKKIQRGRLGSSSKTPLIKGVVSNQDKPPWKHIEPLEAKIESQFLMSVYTGQSVAPFRILNKNTAIIPYTKSTGVMNAEESAREGYIHLSSYLEKVEQLWSGNSKGQMTFKQQIDFRNKLSKQFTPDSQNKPLLTDRFPVSKKLKVVYTASGTHAAAVLLEGAGVIDTSLYYTEVGSKDEGLYLEGVLNSDSLIKRIRGLQSQGLWGARHIHRHLLKPYFPKYNSKEQLHKSIADYASQIKQTAMSVELDPNCNFIKARQKIREKIKKSPTWKKLNLLVNEILERDSSEKAS